jgi:methionyl-tRNA formyltransferase
LNIAVAATAPLGADVLERLSQRHEIAFLLTRPDRPRGRGRQVGAPPAKDAAERLGIEVRQPEKLDESAEVDDVEAVVVAAYGALIPEALLDRTLWLNVHPSLLPRWRGAAPVERALMAGDSETGVTIIKLVKELDAGPVAAQRSLAVAPEDDAGAVYARAAELAVDLLDDVLAQPSPVFQEQSGEAIYAHKITSEDRQLDLERPAVELVDRVRALSPHIGARAELHGRSLTVWRARVAGDGAFQPVEVQPDGGRRMTYDAWRRGLRP